MPHPRFRTNWEENSYWRHYDNHMEEMREREEAQAREEAEQAKPKPNRQGLVAAGDGWFTVANANTNRNTNRNNH